MKFHEELKAQRLDRGYGLREFAERAGIEPARYANIEHGREAVSWTDLLAIFEAMGFVGASTLANLWVKPFKPEPQ